MSICKQRREGDEYACTCGLRWDLGEEDPHREPSFGHQRLKPYDLPEMLHAKFIRNPLFNKVVKTAQQDGDSYTEMLEKALFVHIDAAEDAERKLTNLAHSAGPETLKQLRKDLEK